MSRLKASISQLGIREQVAIVDGFLKPQMLTEHILATDAVCLPFKVLPADIPLSILEAMALGKCVITTQIASIPELIGDERGFISTSTNVEALQNAITDVLENPEVVSQRIKKAKHFVQSQRTWDAMGKRLNNILEQVQNV